MTSKTRKNISLDAKYEIDGATAYLTGVEALVRLPILQHQRDKDRGYKTAGFISGYRGSPLGGVDQTLWKAEQFLKNHDIKFVPGINEELAATAVRGSQEVGLLKGSQYDGVFGMWYGKGPGLDRSVDAFRHANAAGTSKFGGVLAVVGDDHACKSSTYPYQSEHIFMSLSMPILAPANVQEVLDLGVYGWEMSRYCGCWVGLKAITENMDSAISAEIDSARINIKIPDNLDLPDDGLNVRLPDTPLAQEERLNKHKIYAALAFARENELNKIMIDCDNPKLGIITSGKSYLDVLQAFDDLGIDRKQIDKIGVRLYKVGMPWPLEPIKTHEFAEELDQIIVVEEKRSVIEDQLTGQLYNFPVDKRPVVVGEFDEKGNELLTNLSELTPAMIARVIVSRLRSTEISDEMKRRVKFINQKERYLSKPRITSHRTPMYCSGCPHNTSTVVPKGSIAGGGIGCHYMSTWSETRPAHNFTQMGGEGVTWTGIAPFTSTKHIFQNLGDGTYFHSGLLAIRQSISSKVNITYKILFNDAVAMTGGQPIDGHLSVQQLVLQLKGEGVKRIEIVAEFPEIHARLADEVVTITHRDELNAVQKSLRETPGTTILIYDQVCAAKKRRRRKKDGVETTISRVLINEAVCEGCGDCSRESNCLSVIPKETEFGRKRQIDQSSCNMDLSCIKGFCPSFVTVTGGDLKKNSTVLNFTDFPDFPTPPSPDFEKPWNILITGVGGTGVLTASAILSMAAYIEGKGVSTMNQTGLAQKFGAVMSHVRIANYQNDIYTVSIPAGDADLMIGCDLVVSASNEALAKVHSRRSHAVINDTYSTTAEFINNPDAIYYETQMKESIGHEIDTDHLDFISATKITNALLSDTIATNFFMMGCAYQKGYIPLEIESIYQAIELNGVAVELNKSAFMWGRYTVVDQNKVEEIIGLQGNKLSLKSSLDEIIDVRYKDLIAYQDMAYADKYSEFVKKVERRESEIQGKDELMFSRAVAKYLYKAMAYKDEYEVARLFTDGRFQKQLNETFEGDVKVNFHLAPPFLPKTGNGSKRPRKIKLGGYMFKIFRGLSSLKRIRCTRLDLFRYSKDRKLDRQLIVETRQTIDTLLKSLTKEKLSHAVEIIELTNTVRGYGHVKEKSYEEYQIKLAKQILLYQNHDV